VLPDLTQPPSADIASRRTIRHVAKRANVSITTVSRAINRPELLEADTLKRVRAAIDELQYYPNTQARALVSGRSRILGLIVSDITNPFFPDIIQSFESEAVRRGYDALISSTNYDSARMALCVRRMLERNVDGVAIMTSEMDDHLIGQLENSRVPMVFLDVVTPRDRISNVVVDYAGGIQQAVAHLAGLGHTRIAFIAGPLSLKSAVLRREAFVRALADHQLPCPACFLESGNHKVEGGRAAMDRLLRLPERPTAIVASNDLTAIGVMGTARKAGLQIPRDLSIIGFDDIWQAEYMDPPLTTIRLPRERVAERACQALMVSLGLEAPLAGDYSVATELIVRETTTTPPQP